MATSEQVRRVNLDEPRWDQSQYVGRARHFFVVTNPLNCFATPAQLEEARRIVERHRAGEETGLTEEELWLKKGLYDSAFHPETGELMLLGGRMSTQVPMNMVLIGSMLAFYKSTKATIFWQWANQTYNAIVNYTNRSGGSEISTTQLATAYFGATGGALGTALGLNAISHKMPAILARMVPFAAVAAANAINIPCMRFSELQHGIPVFNDEGEKIGESKNAAKRAITQVTVSRVVMASPSMVIPPIVMQALEKKHWFISRRWLHLPTQVGLCGISIVFATPLCCALFPQRASMNASGLEKNIAATAGLKDTDKVWYNKGL